MDKMQNEVTDKIRSAIKEKLMKINAFVDDELPDYIMILVANKRSKHHMEKDLALFLGSETSDFTNWLWDLVNNLKVGTKSKRLKSNFTSNSTLDETLLELQENLPDEDDVLDYDPAEEGESLCLDEMCESSGNKRSTMESDQINNNAKVAQINNPNAPLTILETELSVKSHFKKAHVTKEVQITEIETARSPNKVVEVTSEPKTDFSCNKTVQKSAKVYPVQRVKTNPITSCDVHVEQNPKNEYNPIKSEYMSNLSSIVCVTHRKYGGAAALQANKLLLRAVNDAAKSVLNGKDINDYYKPTPIKVLSSNKFDNIHMESVKTVNDKSNQQTHFEKQLKMLDFTETSDEVGTCIRNIKGEPLQTSRTTGSSELDDFFEDSVIVSSEILQSSILPFENEKCATDPHFIVTLDGVDFSSLKRRHDSDESMEVDEEISIDELSSSLPAKKQKLQEKCKYWPACKNNNSCVYHHPTVPCKCFPECRFGDKCLYIHPNCKFDSLCSRKDCPYTHCSKRVFQVSPPSVTRPVKMQSAKLVCKYYPKCTAKLCRFIHPKLCRFGTECRAFRCPFGHFQIPNRNQLKWKAHKS